MRELGVPISDVFHCPLVFRSKNKEKHERFKRFLRPVWGAAGWAIWGTAAAAAAVTVVLVDSCSLPFVIYYFIFDVLC